MSDEKEQTLVDHSVNFVRMMFWIFILLGLTIIVIHFWGDITGGVKKATKTLSKVTKRDG